MAACLASLLCLDREQVPNFTDAPDIPGMSALQKANHWLATDPLVADRGFVLVKVSHKEHREVWGLPPILCIFSVPSQKYEGGNHAVVGRIHTEDGRLKEQIVHDPNPENQPYPEDVEIRYFQFLVAREVPRQYLDSAEASILSEGVCPLCLVDAIRMVPSLYDNCWECISCGHGYELETKE